MMNWLKKNSYVAVFAGVMGIFVLYMAVTDEQIAKYEQIMVSYGDTLWSIADEYRGKMSTEDWIVFVKKENGLFHRDLQAGQTISVPIEQDSIYIAKLLEGEGNEVKVADYR